MAELTFAELLDEAARNSRIRRDYKEGKTQDELAKEYGLSQSMISLIVNKKRGK